jgi:hypothetical protein
MDLRYRVADAQRIDDVLQGQAGGVSAVDRLDHFDPHAREARCTAEVVIDHPGSRGGIVGGES